MKKTKLIKIMSFLMIICMMFTLAACGGTSQASAPAAASASAGEPNTIIKNAAIFTSDAENTVAQAIVIKDGIIEYVGDEEGAAEFENENSEIIDMNGLARTFTRTCESLPVEQGVYRGRFAHV